MWTKDTKTITNTKTNLFVQDLVYPQFYDDLIISLKEATEKIFSFKIMENNLITHQYLK